MVRSLLNRVSFAIVGALTGLAIIVGAAFAWNGHVDGKPVAFEAGGTDGYYLWHNDDGFHLRTTDSAGVFEYSGVLRTNGTFTNLKLVKAEADDRADLLDGGKVIQFRFKTAEGIDGLDVQVVGASRIHVLLDRNGKHVDPANIFLGENGVHPDNNPFWLNDRQPKATATPSPTPAFGPSYGDPWRVAARTTGGRGASTA